MTRAWDHGLPFGNAAHLNYRREKNLYKMLRETRLTMPVMAPDFALLFIFRFPLLNFGARYGNDSRCPPFESRDSRFVWRWLRFFHGGSVPNESARSNVAAKPGKRIPPNLTS
jgi:hypothetical protein